MSSIFAAFLLLIALKATVAEQPSSPWDDAKEKLEEFKKMSGLKDLEDNEKAKEFMNKVTTQVQNAVNDGVEKINSFMEENEDNTVVKMMKDMKTKLEELKNEHGHSVAEGYEKLQKSTAEATKNFVDMFGSIEKKLKEEGGLGDKAKDALEKIAASFTSITDEWTSKLKEMTEKKS